ncbi:MAG: N-acetylmuramoyl-L-alanine amidase [Gemmatimonadota bacterium]
MKPAASALIAALILSLGAFSARDRASSMDPVSARVTAGDDVVSVSAADEYVAWTRPDVPIRVALQAGHWKAHEAPDEQRRLRANGTRGGGKAEWEVNLDIAKLTATLVEEAGYEVEILPTTIPPGYWADLFVSIHADGNTNTSLSGYRAAAPRRDRTGRAEPFKDLLMQTYGAATGLPVYPTVTRRMTSYYAFNSRRYDHALHPETVGVILETGFLTSARDRRIIIGAQDRAARGIADAVITYLQTIDTVLPPQARP